MLGGPNYAFDIISPDILVTYESILFEIHYWKQRIITRFKEFLIAPRGMLLGPSDYDF